jgi:hypothetical protein
MLKDFGTAMMSYRLITLADLGGRLADVHDAKTRWKLVWEFLSTRRRSKACAS